MSSLRNLTLIFCMLALAVVFAGPSDLLHAAHNASFPRNDFHYFLPPCFFVPHGHGQVHQRRMTYALEKMNSAIKKGDSIDFKIVRIYISCNNPHYLQFFKVIEREKL